MGRTEVPRPVPCPGREIREGWGETRRSKEARKKWMTMELIKEAQRNRVEIEEKEMGRRMTLIEQKEKGLR